MKIPTTQVQPSTSVLHDLRDLDIDSEGFALRLVSILKSQEHYDAFESTLPREGRKKLIDLLDRVSLSLDLLALALRCYY
jgi:hypothetical protein